MSNDEITDQNLNEGAIESTCTKFCQLILRKIIKIVATRCQILRLKCTKFDFGWAPPQTPLGELTALPRPLAGFEGLLLRQGKGGGRKKDREGKEGIMKKKRGGRGSGGRGRGRGGESPAS